ncbi:DUF2194 domain-containing protein [Salibacterium salarium]|uniref:DUF2194 domain-containing protein n=1 Tax=Salibacterium salarium TaxID=284579 RepID=A0A428N906_9BACI|nr:DUF2194 domain-containing protein [Salibacterium salarium]RSL34830.1 DUF2194 domain-containing protein [Salibacterium salarium]
MKKVWLKLVVIVLFFIISIGVFQFYNTGNIHSIFTPIHTNSSTPQTMSDDGEKESTTGQQLKTYIYKDDSTLSQDVSENIKQALTYAKIPSEQIGKEDITSITPSPYHVLILTGTQSDNWSLSDIQEFTAGGGRVIIANRFLNKQWDEFVGMEQNNGYAEESVTGLTVKDSLFPGYPDISTDSDFIENSSLDVTLQEDTDVYAETEQTPILWSHSYEEGEVVYWNASMTDEKNFRGLLLHSIGISVPSMVTSQAATKVMFIDDFPAPVPDGSNEAIQRDYDMSIADFYRDIWWEDMKDLGGELNLTYTGAFIGTYRDDMTLDVEDLQRNEEDTMVYFGRELLEQGGEIGFHGYNHQSLVTKEEPIDPTLGYKNWDSRAEMEEGIERSSSFYKYYFPNQKLNTYVPPSNVLNEKGKKALEVTMPQLQTIASLYVGNPEKGDYVQEFELDEEVPDLYHLPRITSDYSFGNMTQFVLNDAIANFGMVSHFIHPDDVLDPDRSHGEGWPQMKAGFEEIFATVDNLYPYLQDLTAAEAREKLLQYEKSNVEVTYTDQSIVIQGDGMVKPFSLLVRLNKNQSLETGTFSFGTIDEMNEKAGLYQITMTEPYATLEMKEGTR